jgi:tetratricopeptide (TPR) repeat protein
VAEDRNQLEQQAMLLLQKDKKDEAIDVYLKLLKLSKGDIRVRQKLADLYLAMGRKPEAIRQLRDVAAGQMKEGQHRAAVVILKKLHELNPTDAPTLGQLGDAQRAVGFLSDAKETYDKVIDMLTPTPKLAFPYVESLVAISPGEIQAKVKLAEVLGRCGRSDEAFEQWVKLGRESRRRGSTLDQALFMERGLKIKEEDTECLGSAAEARISLGAPKEALVHIQKSYALEPGSTRVLSMLAQCFELMDQQDKAKKVLLQLAKTLEESGGMVERLDALNRALACDPDDAELKEEVGSAGMIAGQIQMRLTDQAWSKPQSEDEGVVVFRARILSDYGFPDRARTLLEESNGVRESVSVRAMLAEVLVKLGELDAAITEMEGIDIGDDGKEDVSVRVLVLREDFDSLGAGAALDEMEFSVEEEDDDDGDMELEMDDPEVEDSTEQSDAGGDSASLGDRLAEAGDREGAIAAYQQALERDPSNEAVLMKLGEIIASGDDTGPSDLPGDALEPVGAASKDFSGFGGIVEQKQAPVSRPTAATPSVEMAPIDPEYHGLLGMLMIGKVSEVEARIEGREDLLCSCLQAEIACLSGDAKKARRVLQEAMDEVDEDAVGYSEGLWGLARYAAMVGKTRTAGRLLSELKEIAPGHRVADILTLEAGIHALDS